jgi:hypothetical protein
MTAKREGQSITSDEEPSIEVDEKKELMPPANSEHSLNYSRRCSEGTMLQRNVRSLGSTSLSGTTRTGGGTPQSYACIPVLRTKTPHERNHSPAWIWPGRYLK